MLFADDALPIIEKPASYRVLARKYRPQNFGELIGQEALVTTLTNALQMGRLAHAWMLTGIRGVGKTTTARIIAKALNCTAPKTARGASGVEPCNACETCISIRDGRNMDVIEMDAASNTGVDNMREIIDGARYAPTAAVYKVYIIDEVHMLSKNAFNALLKTLEEPPPHVKFILATTEIRKVPVTILSRCQRFDLRRFDLETLIMHFKDVLQKEGITADDDALQMLASAADGSARDGLSLVDQAIALASVENTTAHITAVLVQSMLGLANRERLYELLNAVFAGDAKTALTIFADLYRIGADPLIVLNDLLAVIHTLTRLKAAPDHQADLPELERNAGTQLAAAMTLPVLMRAWQMLLKGVAEVAQAPQPQTAAEMILLRLIYAAQLPPPGDLVKQLQGMETATAATPAPLSPPHSGGHTVMKAVSNSIAQVALPQISHATRLMPQALELPNSYPAAVALFAAHKEAILHAQLYGSTHLVSYAPGRIALRLAPNLPRDFTGRVSQKLKDWTGSNWLISIENDGGAETLAVQDSAKKDAALVAAAAHPFVSAALEIFPGARLLAVKQPDVLPDAATGDEP